MDPVPIKIALEQRFQLFVPVVDAAGCNRSPATALPMVRSNHSAPGEHLHSYRFRDHLDALFNERLNA
jgi:hypothetical protein